MSKRTWTRPTREQMLADTTRAIAAMDPKVVACSTVEDDGDIAIVVVTGDPSRGVPAVDWVANVAQTSPESGLVSSAEDDVSEGP